MRHPQAASHQRPHLLGWWMVTHTVRPPRASLRQGVVISVDSQQWSGGYALLPALLIRASVGYNCKKAGVYVMLGIQRATLTAAASPSGPPQLHILQGTVHQHVAKSALPSPQKGLHHAHRHLRVQAAAQGKNEGEQSMPKSAQGKRSK